MIDENSQMLEIHVEYCSEWKMILTLSWHFKNQHCFDYLKILMSKHIKYMQFREPSPWVQSNLEWFLIYPLSVEQNSKTKEREKQKESKGRCLLLVRGNSETVCWHEPQNSGAMRIKGKDIKCPKAWVSLILTNALYTDI